MIRDHLVFIPQRRRAEGPDFECAHSVASGVAERVEVFEKFQARRSRLEPEYELGDTGVFDEGRFFDVTVEYAKIDVNDIAIRISVTNQGPKTARIVVLPSKTQPASRTRATGGASCAHGPVSPAAVPSGAGRPETAMLSLMVIGTPSSALNGMPVGVQVISLFGHDATALSVAAMLEEALRT